MKRDKRPLYKREFVYSLKECEAVFEIPWLTFRHYRKHYYGFPAFPTTKTAIGAWLQRNKLPRRTGPLPTVQAEIARMHEQEGLSLREISRRKNRAFESVRMAYQRHLKRQQPMKR